jgi:hypothetical protein
MLVTMRSIDGVAAGESKSFQLIDFTKEPEISPQWFVDLLEKISGSEGVEQRIADPVPVEDLSWEAEVAIWILEKIGDLLAALGKYLLMASPEILLVFSMILILGSMVGIRKCGMYAIVSTVMAIVMQTIAKGLEL